MTDRIRAPWTPEQVAALNRFQREGGMHPFTCVDQGGPWHARNVPLEATANGWECPSLHCHYRQDWAHAFMADPNAWPKPFADLRPATGQPAQTTPDNPATSNDTADNPLRADANAWRHKAVRRALTISKLRATIDACTDLTDEEITDRTGWGDGYRAAISDLREVLREFGHIEASAEQAATETETTPTTAPPR